MNEQDERKKLLDIAIFFLNIENRYRKISPNVAIHARKQYFRYMKKFIRAGESAWKKSEQKIISA